MLSEYSTIVEQMFLHYNVEELERWKSGDIELVPEKNLNYKGPGLSNGYGYGEFFAKRYLELQGHYVFSNDFDFTSKNSMHESNNRIIREVIGDELFNKIHMKISQASQLGIVVKEPDLLVIKPKMFFIEVKRDNDHIQPGQDTFAILVQNLFNIPFKVCRVLPNGRECNLAPMIFTKQLPVDLMKSHL